MHIDFVYLSSTNIEKDCFFSVITYFLTVCLIEILDQISSNSEVYDATTHEPEC